MNSLPQELVDHTSSYLDPVDLKQMLTVSKAFQRSAERFLLRDFNLKENNADRFLQLYTGDRFQYLRHIHFLTTFPKLEFDKDVRYKCREGPDDLLEKDTSFSRQIFFLFKTLKMLEDQRGASEVAGKLRLTVLTPRRAVNWPCLHRVCIGWRVHLLHPEKLPRVSSIHALMIKNADRAYRNYFNPLYGKYWKDRIEDQVPSKLDLRILVDLAAKLPNLEYMKCSIDNYYWGMTMDHETTKHFTQDWAGPHRDTRNDFAHSVDSTVLPTSLKHVCIDLGSRKWLETGRNQHEQLPDFVWPLTHDPFSTSLRILSYQLEDMALRVSADKTLFWPTDETIPQWPNLKYLDVMVFADSPSGAWYFQGPQGEGSDTSPGYEITQAHYEPLERTLEDEHYDDIFCVRSDGISVQFRVVPIEETLRPFLASFAQAATNMPSLQKAVLWAAIEYDPPEDDELSAEIDTKFGRWQNRDNLAWGIAYASPGHHIWLEDMGHRNCATRQLWWATNTWRPDEPLHSLFRGIGQVKHGNEMLEHWASDHGHKWISRASFLDALSGKLWLKRHKR